MNVTGLRDWARLGGGGLNAEGNAILYRVIFQQHSYQHCIDHARILASSDRIRPCGIFEQHSVIGGVVSECHRLEKRVQRRVLGT